jgi:hypothetical protein
MSKPSTESRLAALEALVASQAAALAEANARLAARPALASDPFVYTLHTHRDPKSDRETTYLTLQNRTGDTITLPAGHEIAFFVQGNGFSKSGRKGAFLRPTRDGVKPIPARTPAAEPTAPAAAKAPESIDF